MTVLLRRWPNFYRPAAPRGRHCYTRARPATILLSRFYRPRNMHIIVAILINTRLQLDRYGASSFCAT